MSEVSRRACDEAPDRFFNLRICRRAIAGHAAIGPFDAAVAERRYRARPGQECGHRNRSGGQFRQGASALRHRACRERARRHAASPASSRKQSAASAWISAKGSRSIKAEASLRAGRQRDFDRPRLRPAARRRDNPRASMSSERGTSSIAAASRRAVSPCASCWPAVKPLAIAVCLGVARSLPDGRRAERYSRPSARRSR